MAPRPRSPTGAASTSSARSSKRSKQYRHQYRRAVAFLAYDAAQLLPIDVAVADVLLDVTHGGTRDYRTTEARIAARLPSRRDGRAVSKRIASDALIVSVPPDWSTGTTARLRTSTTRSVGPCWTGVGKALRRTGC